MREYNDYFQGLACCCGTEKRCKSHQPREASGGQSAYSPLVLCEHAFTVLFCLQKAQRGIAIDNATIVLFWSLRRRCLSIDSIGRYSHGSFVDLSNIREVHIDSMLLVPALSRSVLLSVI